MNMRIYILCIHINFISVTTRHKFSTCTPKSPLSVHCRFLTSWNMTCQTSHACAEHRETFPLQQIHLKTDVELCTCITVQVKQSSEVKIITFLSGGRLKVMFVLAETLNHQSLSSCTECNLLILHVSIGRSGHLSLVALAQLLHVCPRTQPQT